MILFQKRSLEMFFNVICLGAVLLAVGCAGSPDITGPGRTAAPDHTGTDLRQIAVDQPFLVSGDYFRKKEAEGGLNLKMNMGGDEKTDENQADLEKRVARLENETARTAAGRLASPGPAVIPAAKGNDGMKIKVGMLVDRRGVDGDGARLLSNAACLTSARFPVVPVSPKEITEALARRTAADYGDLKQVAREIAVFPGVRMLVLIDKFQFPATYPGKAVASVNVVDAGTLHRYPLPAMEVAVKTEADVEKFALTVMTEAFDRAVKHSGLMPWFCRVFAREGQTFYVTAGEKSGLKPGDRLNVVTNGKLIKAPSGIPAGWIPGRSSGVLRVELNFGKDLSACTLVEGDAPKTEDLLTRP